MRKVLKVLVLVWATFILVSAFTGGDVLRHIGGKLGGVFNTFVYAAADKADSLKAELESYVELLRDWNNRKAASDGNNS